MHDEPIGRETPVHITKYDGSYHRRWPSRYVMRKGPLYLLTFASGQPISRTPDPDDDPNPVMARYGGNVYLYDDRWFNICRMPRDGRSWYYVNIATPPRPR
jgi:protein associated with RNAse G/E